MKMDSSQWKKWLKKWMYMRINYAHMLGASFCIHSRGSSSPDNLPFTTPMQIAG